MFYALRGAREAEQEDTSGACGGWEGAAERAGHRRNFLHRGESEALSFSLFSFAAHWNQRSASSYLKLFR